MIQMKKIFSLLGLILVLNACDDGDVTVQNISFDQVTTTNACNNNYFKIKGTEMLLFRITEPNEIPFPNEITLPNAPRVFAINSYNKVFYRNYSGTPAASNICDALPPSSPSVIEEWTAIGGTIEITTTAVKTAPDANNATKITGYNHYIVFKNLIFQKPVGTQAYGSDFVFGYYNTPTTLSFPVANQTFKACNPLTLTISTIYNQVGAEGVVLSNLDATLFTNTVTTAPIVRNLGTTNNVLKIKTFNANLPTDYFCTNPTTPTNVDTWEVDLVATTPTIEVTTTAASGVYTHNIHLKNVTIKKTGTYPVSFYLGDDFILGNLIR